MLWPDPHRGGDQGLAPREMIPEGADPGPPGAGEVEATLRIGIALGAGRARDYAYIGVLREGQVEADRILSRLYAP